MEQNRIWLNIRQIANTILGPLSTGFIAYVNVQEFDNFFTQLDKAWPFVIAMPIFYGLSLITWFEHYGQKFGRLKTALVFTVASVVVVSILCSVHF